MQATATPTQQEGLTNYTTINYFLVVYGVYMLALSISMIQDAIGFTAPLRTSRFYLESPLHDLHLVSSFMLLAALFSISSAFMRKDGALAYGAVMLFVPHIALIGWLTLHNESLPSTLVLYAYMVVKVIRHNHIRYGIYPRFWAVIDDRALLGVVLMALGFAYDLRPDAGSVQIMAARGWAPWLYSKTMLVCGFIVFYLSVNDHQLLRNQLFFSLLLVPFLTQFWAVTIAGFEAGRFIGPVLFGLILLDAVIVWVGGTGDI